MRATIKDVAKLAGVSTATVSNVITRKKYVSPELIEKITKAMEELDYTPNTIARSLKVNRSFRLGLIVPDITNPFFGEIVKYAEKVANKENYHITLCDSDQSVEKERQIINTFIENGVDGIINVAPRMKDRELNKKRPVPMVIVDRPAFDTDKNIAFVFADNFEGGNQVAKRFVEQGFKKFLCLAGPVDIVPNAKKRLMGFQEYVLDQGFDETDIEFRKCNFSFESGYEVMKEYLQTYEKKEQLAAFISSDIMAWGAMEAIKDMGLRVPEDIAVIGYDNIFFSNFIHPRLTTIDNPTKQLGTMSTQLLLDAIESKESLKGNYVVLNSKLVERQSDERLPF